MTFELAVVFMKREITQTAFEILAWMRPFPLFKWFIVILFFFRNILSKVLFFYAEKEFQLVYKQYSFFGIPSSQRNSCTK